MSDAARVRALLAAASSAAERWSLPAVEGPVVGLPRGGPGESAKAREAEHARGYEAGLAQARAEVSRQTAELEARVRRLDALLQMQARPLSTLDDEVLAQLARLAMAVGKQLARRELKADPSQIIAVIREAVSQLPAAARDVRVHLHPEDAAVIREHLAQPSQERAWSVVEDPTQARGGCLVRTDTSLIDARFESRVQAIAAALFGDERAAQRASAEIAGAPGSSGER